ncbi:unnamed protein product [Mytilus coruscus]|uniref:Tc1-like transposase DDE domain-containing protein n=1 Tax=Mytilus coruscus TaxID=42192 RepID=A0A6J8C6I1_MYTCO|nr:unnamed protein product [Mytilus coruscus]
MGRVDDKIKQEIAVLRKSGNTIQAITGILRTRGHNISRHSVRYWLRAYDRDFISELGVHVQPKQRTFRKVSERDAELIKELIKSDFSMSSKQIHKALVADGANMSLSLTKIAIDAAGFTHSRPRYGQMVRRANRPKRVDFCQHLIDENDDFADIIFSDESSIQTFQNKTNYYREKDSAPMVHGKPKHPLKVHVWGAISRRGPSKLTIFEDIMEKEFFTNSILRDNLLSYVRVKFPDGHRFQQDNDPKHKSKMAKEFMNDNGINWWNIWPSESPDLNPIEMVWNQMKRHVARVDPKTKEELVNTLQTFWCEMMTVEQCNMYIDHIYKVAPVCVLMNGAATGHLPDKIFPERTRGKSLAYFNNKLKTDPDVIKRLKGLQFQ